jgi:hypothetical protein
VSTGPPRILGPRRATPVPAVIEGRWTPRVYDETWFARETLAATGGRIGEIYRPNPPVASLIVLPFAGFDVPTARPAWLAVEVAPVIAARLLWAWLGSEIACDRSAEGATAQRATAVTR